MTELIILGSSAAIPSQGHVNTHMALRIGEEIVLIDCVGSQIIRLQEAELDVSQVSDIILTHFHPDHVGGLPLLLMNMWLLGRSSPLELHGLAACLDRVEQMMECYEWREWPDFFEVTFHPVPKAERSLLLEKGDVRILSSPVEHIGPTIGLRIESGDGNRVVVYSSDTEPCESLRELCAGANLLIHEASGKGVGHSSAEQAGEVAEEAGVPELMLIHYPTYGESTDTLIREAQANYSGEVTLARDFFRFTL